jgi:hypothetical protein
VNLLPLQKNKYVFRLENRESELFKLVLSLYPVIPSAHQPLSKSSPEINQESQRLLDEALAEQRNENKSRVRAFLDDEKRLRQLKTSWRLILTAAEIDWLLQVLNDVRVGNWILLGSPDEEMWTSEPTEQTAPYMWAMELAASFQMDLLEAVAKKS